MRRCTIRRWGAALCLLVNIGCGEERDDYTDLSSFDAFFELVATIELEEKMEDPIVGFDHLSRTRSGGFMFADERAGVVRVFESDGRIARVLGQPGDGPGELRGPTAAAELTNSRVLVVQRADPKLTLFDDGTAPIVGRLPGQYGFWTAPFGPGAVVGLGSRTERFALLSAEGETESTFGMVDPAVIETPFWIFFAADHAAVLGNEIAINTSFFPTVRVFDSTGDSVRTLGYAPPSWIQAMPPPVEAMADEAARERITRWSETFTVVRDIAAVGDLLVVQYGRHVAIEEDPYRVTPQRIDVYDPLGQKLAEDVDFSHPIVGGGDQLVVLTAEPPSPWTIALYEWRAPRP